MPLTSTEKDILNSVKRLRKPTFSIIARDTHLCIFTVKSVCRELVRKGYLELRHGYRFTATKKQPTDLPDAYNPHDLDKNMIKEIADQVAKEISNQIRGIKIMGAGEEEIKIKTDFIPQVEDDTLQLESNIDKLSAEFEKEKSNIEKSVNLFKNMKK